MLGTFFGFGGRIGRLQYFGFSMVLGIAMTVIAMVSFASAIGHSAGKGTSAAGVASSFLPLLILVPLFLWSSLALQAKRIRDIGWNPAVIIPVWMVVSTGAGLTGIFGGKGSGIAALGGLINLCMSGVLLLWPGDGRRHEDGDGEGGRWQLPEQFVYHEPPPFRAAPVKIPGDPPSHLVPPPVRPAPRPAPPPPRGPGGFGKRGLS